MAQQGNGAGIRKKAPESAAPEPEMPEQKRSGKRKRSKQYRKTLRQGLAMIVAVLALVVLSTIGTYLRDYRIETSPMGTPEFVAKTAVPFLSTLSIDNSVENKLTCTTGNNGLVDSYEFRYSRWHSMFFAHNARSETPTKTFAMLHSGATYYIQVRAYVINSSGRKVHGSWSPIRSAVVK